jgi:two-component system phosphate regulon sensor histidine kinase PhoR
VICGLFTCTFASERESRIAEENQLDGSLQWLETLVLVFNIAGALGVVLFGWYLLKLAGVITSIAKLPMKEDAGVPVKSIFSLPSIKRMNGIYRDINKQLNDYGTNTNKYYEQIDDLRIQLQISQSREKNTEAIIYGIRDAVIVIDEFEKVSMVNESAGKIFNFEYKNAKYKPIKDLIGLNNKDFLDFLSHSIKSKKQATKKEIILIEKGISKIYDCIISCIHDEDGKITGVVAVLHDITREKEISKLKNDFISHVSHELKTPLASITAYSEMLADGEAETEEAKKEFYSIIQKQAERLNRLIEDILNTSRIESGLMKIKKEHISLTILIEEQIQMIKSYAEEKNIEVIGQKPIVFDQVFVDKDMISQVIVNLLSNAVKYTQPGGSVTIKTEINQIEGNVCVSITDTGVGIPEEEIEHVFDKYYRVEANNKQAKGTGLGLNLVKQIVENVHEGRIFATSKVGVGSTFGFELPLAINHTVGAI